MSSTMSSGHVFVASLLAMSLTAFEGQAKRMPSGIVKWFSEKKGYGFIFREGEEDVFVHHASFQSSDGEILAEGDEVEFEIVNGPQGPLAQHVVRS